MTVFYKLGKPYFDEKYKLYGRPGWDSVYGRAEWSESMPEGSLERISCSANPNHRRSGNRLAKLVVVLPSPRVGDFVWTWYSECLITERVLKLFREAGLTGFDVQPVRIERVKRVRKDKSLSVPQLHELVAVGQGGEAHLDSGIRVFQTCDACGLKAYSSYTNGIVVNEKQWDGSDFFTVRGYPKFILVTERVKDLVVSQQLTNCVLIPSQELRWPDGSVRPEEVRYT